MYRFLSSCLLAASLLAACKPSPPPIKTKEIPVYAVKGADGKLVPIGKQTVADEPPDPLAEKLGISDAPGRAFQLETWLAADPLTAGQTEDVHAILVAAEIEWERIRGEEMMSSVTVEAMVAGNQRAEKRLVSLSEKTYAAVEAKVGAERGASFRRDVKFPLELVLEPNDQRLTKVKIMPQTEPSP